MKILFLPLLFMTLAGRAQSSSPTRDTLLTRLQKLKTEAYLDKSTDSILAVLPEGFEHSFQPSTRPLLRQMVVLTYKDRPYFRVHLFYERLQRTHPQQISKTKQLQSLRKETVRAIEIYQASLCIRGCER